MQQSLEIFVNGIAGVFAGMVVLYFSIRIISVIAAVLEKKHPGEEQ